jgi:pectinesterase
LDGTGDHRTVQEAIDKAPRKGGKRFLIRIKPGTYHEKITIPANKGPIILQGEDAKTTTLDFDDYAGKLDEKGNPLGTANCWSVQIDADEFVAENITFRNSHRWQNSKDQQALALSFTGDRAIFRRCRFLSWQDTLYLARNRQYFVDCLICGNVDFIFGGATSYFERCELHCVSDGVSITAASTPKDQPFGFVFSRCTITAAQTGDWKTHLGRPWRPHAKVAFLNTQMGPVVAPEGWNNWDDPANERTASFSEFRSDGPGGTAAKRVSWSKQLSAEEATKYAPGSVLKGTDGWNPVGNSQPMK